MLVTLIVIALVAAPAALAEEATLRVPIAPASAGSDAAAKAPNRIVIVERVTEPIAAGETTVRPFVGSAPFAGGAPLPRPFVGDRPEIRAVGAAATLVALNALHGEPLGVHELAAAAAGLGSDVPFFIRSTVAKVSGRGIELVPLPSIDGTMLIAAPKIAMADGAEFRGKIEMGKRPDAIRKSA